jgi:periplasmic protein TonB
VVFAGSPVAPTPEISRPAPPQAVAGVSVGPKVSTSEIRDAVQAAARYPRLARSQGIEGTVTVRFRLVNGRAAGASIHQSAGDPLLDEAALQAVAAARFPPTQEERWVRVPVVFGLDMP